MRGPGDGRARPPGLFRRVLEWAAGRLGLPDLPADAAELYGDEVRRNGLRAARRWYRRQALATLGRLFAPRRTSEEPRRHKGGGVSWLDVKLGVRMLLKYPGLSLVSVFGMAVAITVAAGYMAAIQTLIDPELPLPDGARLVSLRMSDARRPGQPERRILLDFASWKQEARTLRDLAAFRTDRKNLIGGNGSVESVRVAEMTASGFRALGVPPALGRTLLDGDEEEGATPVVVIGWDEWQQRFDGDREAVGRTVHMGDQARVLVGVMPEGFRAPVNHGFWIPLHLDPTEYDWGQGPSIEIFGRLAEGATLGQARAELSTLGLRAAAAHPATHRYLRPQVLPYVYPLVGVDSPGVGILLRVVQASLALLLALVSVNVAVLVYARTATRSGEIAVRSALGASRARVVAQLFVEALVLSGLAAALGLTFTGTALSTADRYLRRTWGSWTPFWFDLHLSAEVVLYVGGLAILAGVIIGVIPALKATGRNVQPGLQSLANRGSGMQLGRTWTVLIVAQVAVAVVGLPSVLYVTGQTVVRGTAAPAYPTEEILQAWLSINREEGPPAAEEMALRQAEDARFGVGAVELLRRLKADPAVAGVTFGATFPDGGGYQRVEVMPEGGGATSGSSDGAAAGGSVRTNQVAPNLFAVYGVPILMGRGFVEADVGEGTRAAIVGRSLADRYLGGRGALGRSVRIVRRVPGPEPGGPPVEERGPWLEVVGVVPDFTVQYDFDPPQAHLFTPMAVGPAAEHSQSPAEIRSGSIALVVRVRGGQASRFAARLREITAQVDPTLQLSELQSAAEAVRTGQRGLLYLALGVGVGALAVLLLSAAGIYAMMSFTVARRRREIGIRTALGADPRRLLMGIFGRASAQLGVGVLLGLVLASLIGGPVAGKGLLMLPVVAVFMVGVGLLAAVGPARRGLALEVMEVLREE